MHSAQPCFTLPWGQGLHSAQLDFALPCEHRFLSILFNLIRGNLIRENPVALPNVASACTVCVPV